MQSMEELGARFGLLAKEFEAAIEKDIVRPNLTGATDKDVVDFGQHLQPITQALWNIYFLARVEGLAHETALELAKALPTIIAAPLVGQLKSQRQQIIQAAVDKLTALRHKAATADPNHQALTKIDEAITQLKEGKLPGAY